jgi:hypothetical protein
VGIVVVKISPWESYRKIETKVLSVGNILLQRVEMLLPEKHVSATYMVIVEIIVC